MGLSDINVSEAIKQAREVLSRERDASPAMVAVVQLLITIVELFCQKFNTNSRNGSVAPSQDPHRPRGRRYTKAQRKTGRKPGGQPGHNGSTIEPVEHPDEVEKLWIDRRTLPKGKRYREVEDDVRQVIEIKISRHVKEYRSEVLEDEDGNQYRAEFPEGVMRPAQYGATVKAQVLYLNSYELLPYSRVQDYFQDQAQIGISQGTIGNIIERGYELLEPFEDAAKRALRQAACAHFDETGININGKLTWLHSASNQKWTLQVPHPKRGEDAMKEMGILPEFKGIACHDHWKAYFRYSCEHALCNAHHLRELQWVIENEGHRWAQAMKAFLEGLNREVEKAGGRLSAPRQKRARKNYRRILRRADQECPPAPASKEGKRQKRTKEQNLIERLKDFEDETLRFMTNPLAPFTNNQGERDIRMSKVQQKISGCFRSVAGARAFCRIRSYISTCMKNGIQLPDALAAIFTGGLSGVLSKIIESG